MKKIIAIGDIHGRDTWKQIVNDNPDADRIIFMGDYFDPPSSKRHLGNDGEAEYRNFMDIIKYKIENMDKVVLLIGNHDYHYIPDIDSTCWGFQSEMLDKFNYILGKSINRRLMKWVHAEDGYLFSHAGVTKTWMRNLRLLSVDEINSVPKEYFGFTPGDEHDGYGDEICQTPIWVRPHSLLKDSIDDYTLVVGHTPQPEGISIVKNVLFIDCLDVNKYLIIKDGLPEEGTVNEKISIIA